MKPTTAEAETSTTKGDRPKYPLVSVVIPTHNRPELLRKTLASVIAQDYAGCIEVVIVFDRAEPDASLQSEDAGRTVRVLRNNRTPGLAGNRNTGILSARGDIVAFCDDDDTWQPAKLTRQVAALMGEPQYDFVTTAMTVEYLDRSIVRLADRGVVDHGALIDSRMGMLHSSSFMARKSAFLGEMGLVDETLPESMAEDRELLLRASRLKPILHIDQPLVNVRWADTSYFAQDWERRIEAGQWLLEHYPEIVSTRTGAGLTYGKLAVGNAAQRKRRDALCLVYKTIRSNWKEPRAYIALAVLAGVSPAWILKLLNRRGRGI